MGDSMNPLAQVNWDALKTQLTEQAVSTLRDLLDGAAADLQQYAAAIAADQVALLQAPAEKRAALQAELIGQLRTLAEINRLRANEAAWNQVTIFVNTITETAVRVLVAAALTV